MGAALHTIRVDHFNLCSMLRRLLALADILDPYNAEDLSGPIALILQFIDNRAARAARGNAETILREALFQRAFDASPKGKIAPIEPRIHARLRLDLMDALEALQRDGTQLQRFDTAVSSYAEFERWRIAQFETQVMPLALATLGPDDWARVDSDVQRNSASSREASRDREAERLFRAALRSARAAERSVASCGNPAGMWLPGDLPGRHRSRLS